MTLMIFVNLEATQLNATGQGMENAIAISKVSSAMDQNQPDC
jgi:hypothetical protein